mgnify:CR=1 FL=1
MFEQAREFFRSKGGTGVAVGLALIGLVIVFFAMRGAMTDEGAEMSANRVFIDATNNQPFKIHIDLDTPIPAKAPSGGMTGYPSEACYWTKDGKPKTEPTYVCLLYTSDAADD